MKNCKSLVSLYCYVVCLAVYLLYTSCVLSVSKDVYGYLYLTVCIYLAGESLYDGHKNGI